MDCTWLFFYAALIGIPKELDEAAIMDGANVISTVQICKNTVYQTGNHSKLHPGIKMALCVSFDISYLLTKGGPGNHQN